MRPRAFATGLVLLLCASLLGTGCAYMKDRGRDAMDIFDVGILVSDHARPDFGLFLNFWNILPIGYAKVDGKLIGIGNRQAGVLDFAHDHSWGVVGWGAEQRGVAEGARPAPEGPLRYEQGFVRIAVGSGRKPPTHQYFDCDRTFHLGWIGFHLRIKLDDLADFVLGWAGLDIRGDDEPRE